MRAPIPPPPPYAGAPDDWSDIVPLETSTSVPIHVEREPVPPTKRRGSASRWTAFAFGLVSATAIIGVQLNGWDRGDDARLEPALASAIAIVGESSRDRPRPVVAEPRQRPVQQSATVITTPPRPWVTEEAVASTAAPKPRAEANQLRTPRRRATSRAAADRDPSRDTPAERSTFASLPPPPVDAPASSPALLRGDDRDAPALLHRPARDDRPALLSVEPRNTRPALLHTSKTRGGASVD